MKMVKNANINCWKKKGYNYRFKPIFKAANFLFFVQAYLGFNVYDLLYKTKLL